MFKNISMRVNFVVLQRDKFKFYRQKYKTIKNIQKRNKASPNKSIIKRQSNIKKEK